MSLASALRPTHPQSRPVESNHAPWGYSPVPSPDDQNGKIYIGERATTRLRHLRGGQGPSPHIMACGHVISVPVWILSQAGGQGFEPRSCRSERRVLPLDDPPETASGEQPLSWTRTSASPAHRQGIEPCSGRVGAGQPPRGRCEWGRTPPPEGAVAGTAQHHGDPPSSARHVLEVVYLESANDGNRTHLTRSTGEPVHQIRTLAGAGKARVRSSRRDSRVSVSGTRDSVHGTPSSLELGCQGTTAGLLAGDMKDTRSIGRYGLLGVHLLDEDDGRPVSGQFRILPHDLNEALDI